MSDIIQKQVRLKRDKFPALISRLTDLDFPSTGTWAWANSNPDAKIQKIKAGFASLDSDRWIHVVIETPKSPTGDQKQVIDDAEAELTGLCLWQPDDVVCDSDVKAELERELRQATAYWRESVRQYIQIPMRNMVQWYVAHEAHARLRRARAMAWEWNRLIPEGQRFPVPTTAFSDLDTEAFRMPRHLNKDPTLEFKLDQQAPTPGMSLEEFQRWKHQLLQENESLLNESDRMGELRLGIYHQVRIDEILHSNETAGELPLLPPVPIDGEPRLTSDRVKEIIIDFLRRDLADAAEMGEVQKDGRVYLRRLIVLRRDRFEKHGHFGELVVRIRNPHASAPPPEPNAPALENLFRLKGDYWEIQFRGGRIIRIKDCIGLRYMHRLIDHAGNEFAAIELAQAIEKACPPAVFADDRQVLDGTPETRQELVDPTTLQRVRDKIVELKSELKTAVCPDRKVEIENEIETCETYLRKSTYRGRAGSFHSPKSNQRVAITTSIKRARKAIAKELPDLADHFKTAIRTGNHFYYIGGLSWAL